MSAQIPLPSFDDVRKILNFWIDQQDKWFYFATELIHAGSLGFSEVPNQLFNRNVPFTQASKSENNCFAQTRIVGNIHDVVEYPPSLLLQTATFFTTSQNSQMHIEEYLSIKKRDKYGMAFSQITYYEPIDDYDEFIKNDERVKIGKT